MFILPSARSTLTSALPLVAPGTSVTQVDSAAGADTKSPEFAGDAADADLAEFATALGRARVENKTS